MKLLALGVWLAMAASVTIAAWLWRSWDPRPHAAWAALSLAAVLGTSGWLTFAALRAATRGRVPRLALGWWLLGTAPLTGFIVYAANVYIDAMYRQPMTLNAPLRMTAAWAASFFDLEARLRYPRWTYGEQARLLDSGQIPAPEMLVAQMDEHIASMTQLLGQPPLSAPITWVRGSIFGMTGRANGPWAICSSDGSGDALDPIDRHEAAHAVITMLAGPDQDPPAVLAEGWAESQSADRDTQIRHLASLPDWEGTYSLQELITPDWYMRGDGPVYTHGGPLVHYLIERFGAQKFYEFYRDVRRATFVDDCRRVLGVSWDEIEADFWQWLAVENIRLTPVAPPIDEPTKDWKLDLADGVDPVDWRQLAEACRKAQRSRDALPKQFAFAARWKWARFDDNHQVKPLESRNELKAVFDGDDFWICAAEDRESYLMSSLNRCGNLTLARSGDVEGWVGDADSRHRAHREAVQIVSTYRDASRLRPEACLPLGEYVSPAIYRVERIERPAGGDKGIWKVALQIQYEEERATYCELEIDPAIDWQAIRYQAVGSPKSYTEQSAEYRQLDGVWFATAGRFEADYTAVKERVSAETSLRSLSVDEIRDLKRRVGQVILAGPTRPWHRLRNVLQALVVAWPVLGLACIALPLLRKNQLAGGTSAKSAAIAVAMTAPSSGPTTGIQA